MANTIKIKSNQTTVIRNEIKVTITKRLGRLSQAKDKMQQLSNDSQYSKFDSVCNDSVGFEIF